MIIIIITVKIIHNKTMYMNCNTDMKDMFLNKPSYKLSGKQ